MCTLNILQTILKRLPHESRAAAFGYGSGVLRQIGNTSPSNMIDMFVVVRDAEQWHSANLRQGNARHYSFLRHFGAGTLARVQDWQRFGARVYFNTEVECEGRLIKYGIITQAALLEDLRHWRYLYTAGRLQKPVVWVEPGDEELQHAYVQHLQQSMALTLLLLPSTFNEIELFEKVAALSYGGDMLRRIAENSNKVNNIVSGQLADFRRLYGPVLHDMPQVDWRDAISDLLMRHTSPEANAQLLNMLPLSFLKLVAAAANLPRSLHTEQSDDLKSRLSQALVGLETLPAVLTRTVISIVSPSSLQQSLKSALTAGLLKSIKYSLKKLRKK